MATEALSLTVDGADYGGWTSCSVTRTMEAAAGSFSVDITERWPGQDEERPIRAGSQCAVLVSGETLITGYVDDVMVSYSASDHSVSISGRDAACDLVDSSADSGEWHGVALERIVAEIAKPFGLRVAIETGTGAVFEKFRIQPGESAWEAIERACRMRGLLCMSDGIGNIVLARTSTEKPVAIIRGGGKGTILSGSATYSMRDRYSAYMIKGQRPGTDDDAPENAAHGLASVTDPEVRRYRPKVLIAEDNGDSGSLRARADWEAKVARGRSRTASLQLQGWRDANGVLWRPNRVVTVVCDWMRIDQDMLVSSVRLMQGDDGTTASLDLVHPDTFAAEPLDPRQDLGW